MSDVTLRFFFEHLVGKWLVESDGEAQGGSTDSPLWVPSSVPCHNMGMGGTCLPPWGTFGLGS